MLSLEFIRKNKKIVQEGIKSKGSDVDIARILELDEKRRKILKIVEDLRAQRNQVSAILGKDINANQREEHLREAENLKINLREQENYLKEVDEELTPMLRSLPNIPYEDVPVGKDENDNVVLREVGKKPNFKFKPKDYMELAATHDLIDVKRAGKVSGTRFGYLKNEAVRLEFALINFALDVLAKEGFAPIIPPVLIKNEIMRKLGYLEKEPDDIYYIERDDMNLVGTSEHSVAPMFLGETLAQNELPKRFAAFSTCFRREAGSYGKDTKGILRVHQFDKVEMISFVEPDKSREEHKFLLSLQEKLMQALKIPYRVVHISSGDMGFVAAEQFDIEAWLPSENKYRETHSTSNTTDFQARRLVTKYKTKDGNNFVHILNGTALAMGRTLIALIENHQTEKGEIKIPKALQKYTGFNKIG